MPRMSATLTLASAAAAGIAGWCATEFCARPVRRFIELRSAARRRILMLLHMPAAVAVVRGPGAEQRAMPVRGLESAFCELGAELVAFGETEAAVAWAMEWLGLDAVKAGRLLIALSALPQGAERDAYIAGIEHALRLGREVRAARHEQLVDTTRLAA